MQPALGPPPDASLDGHGADALIALCTRVALVALVALAVALVVILVRDRASRTALAPREPRARHVAVAVALACFIVLAADAGLVGAAHRDAVARLWNVPRGPGVVRVEAVAQRFSWSFRLAGADTRFGTADDVVSLDELRVPAGAPVVVALVARDVGHSFFVPALRVKQDAVPGRLALAHFAVRAPGELEIACAQFCGASHYRMRARLVALDRASYAAWLAASTPRALARFDAADLDANWAWPWRD